MKKIFVKIASILTAALFVFAAAGCSNIDAGESSSVIAGGNGSAGAARVAFSQAFELSSIKLSGTNLSTGVSKVFARWDEVPEEEDCTVKIPVGTYKFVLSAKYDGSTVKGECEGTVTKNKLCQLSFNLKRLDNDEWGGDDPADDDDDEEENLPPVEDDAVTGLVEFESLTANSFSGTYTSKTTVNNVIINCTADTPVAVDSNSKTISGVSYSKRIKLQGTGSLEDRNIQIYVGANRKGTLTVHLASSNSKETGRHLMANTTVVGEAPTDAGAISAQVTADENGYIKLYSDSDGINIYGVMWSTGSSAGGEGGVIKVGVSEATLPVLDNSSVAPSFSYGRKVGMRSDICDVETDAILNKLFVAQNGSSSGNGTKSNPYDLQTAIDKATPGTAIVLKGGSYKCSSTITIALGNNGTASARKYILPESGSAVVLDFSAQAVGDSNRGIQHNGNYWHIYGITVYNAGDNGVIVTGKNNIYERCVFQANQDTGLQIARRGSSVSDFAEWPSDNLILNCTSFDNKDDKTGENADGFAAKLTCGNGNVFDGCISYANCDDGWDLYAKPATGSIGVVTIRNCVAYQNGKTTTGANYANGDMNGFKLGGSTNQAPTPHIVSNCAAFNNGKDGFTDNGNGGALKVSNCTSYGNINSNFNFYRTIGNSTEGGVFTNMVAMLGGKTPAQADKFGSNVAVTKATIENVLWTPDKAKIYYQTEKISIINGEKPATAKIVTDPFNSELQNKTAPDIGLDVDAKCRNRDGTINLNGFMEMKAGSPYAELGAHFGDEAENVFECGL